MSGARCRGVIGKKGDASFTGFIQAHRTHVPDDAPEHALEPKKVGDLWVAHCPGCRDYWSTAAEMRVPPWEWQGEVFGRIG